MPEAVELMKAVYLQLSSGQAAVPLRTRVVIEEQDAITLFMPGYLKAASSLGAKIVSVFPHNPERGLPLVSAVIVVLSAETGLPLAIIEGDSVTAIRTGAASGAATDVLAPPNAERGAIFGSGVQARTQLEAICAVRRFSEVRIYSPNPGHVDRFIGEMQPQVEPILLASQTPQEACAGAQVICLATTSTEPVIADADIEPGCHINGVGTYMPEATEIPPATVARSRVVIDSRQAAMAEAGDILLPLRQGLIQEADVVELGAVLAGTASGRTSPEQITFFKSVGIAAQDLICAAHIVRRAEEMGLGIEAPL